MSEIDFTAVLIVAAVLAAIPLVFFAYLYVTDPTPDGFEIDRGLFPFQSHYLQLENGGRLHYLDEGDGPVLLLLHGNPTWSFLYRDIITELKGGFRLVVPDYPGFGLSTAGEGYGYTPGEHARAVDELVRRLDLRDTVIMMQDWGGPIGFDVALKQPGRIAGFVIGNTWAWPLERAGQKVFSRIMGGWPGRLSAWCCNGIVRFFMSKGVATGLGGRELAMYLRPFAKRASRAPTHLFPAQLRGAHAFLDEVHRNLGSLLGRPALLPWGMKDFAFQAPERSRFESLFPDHETVLLENAGHFIQEDAPVEIATAIRDWHERHF